MVWTQDASLAEDLPAMPERPAVKHIGIALLLLSCSRPDEPSSRDALPETLVQVDLVPAEAASKPEPKKFDFELGEFSTLFKFKNDFENRGHNIQITASLLSTVWSIAEDGNDYGGQYLNAGEEFSFNSVVGPRITERSFKMAPEILFGEMTPGVGGGTCQVSSTIHAAAIYSGIKVLYRKAHSRPASYMPPGLDATTNYPPECNGLHEKNAWNGKNPKCTALDLKLKNQYSFPVLLKMKVEDFDEKQQKLTATFYGTEKPPFDVIDTRWSEAVLGKPFEQKFRVTNKWRNDRRKKVQDGRPGRSGSLLVITTDLGGKRQEFRIPTEYEPVHEVWEVGLGWTPLTP
jgi:hypothetical protein